jgi:hypothetical protein
VKRKTVRVQGLGFGRSIENQESRAKNQDGGIISNVLIGVRRHSAPDAESPKNLISSLIYKQNNPGSNGITHNPQPYYLIAASFVGTRHATPLPREFLAWVFIVIRYNPAAAKES